MMILSATNSTNSQTSQYLRGNLSSLEQQGKIGNISDNLKNKDIKANISNFVDNRDVLAEARQLLQSNQTDSNTTEATHSEPLLANQQSTQPPQNIIVRDNCELGRDSVTGALTCEPKGAMHIFINCDFTEIQGKKVDCHSEGISRPKGAGAIAGFVLAFVCCCNIFNSSRSRSSS